MVRLFMIKILKGSDENYKIKKIVNNSDGSVRLLDESAQDSHDEGQED